MKIEPVRGFKDGILSMEQALDVFYDLADVKGIPYHATEGGCLGRAYFMAKLAYNAGAQPRHITAFAKDKENLLVVDEDSRMQKHGGWYYHIAIVLPVQLEGGPVMDLVFDPSMFVGPVSIKQWTKSMKADPNKVFVTGYRKPIPIPNPEEPHWGGERQIDTDHERSAWYDVAHYRQKEKAIKGKREVSLSAVCKNYFINHRDRQQKRGKTWQPRSRYKKSRQI